MKQKKYYQLALGLCALFLLPFAGYSQGVGISSSGSIPNASALLDIDASPSNNKGLLIPRITTTDRNAIGFPAEGLMIFNTTTKCFEAYVNSAWYPISCPATCIAPTAPTAGTHAPSSTQIVWNWNAVAGATGYKWNTTNTYSSATDVGTAVTYTQNSLTCNTAYTLYIWAYNTCGTSSVATLTQNTSACPGTCGTQEWLSIFNLDVGSRINGSIDQTNNSIVEKWCYNDLAANCTTYGGLYQWAEVLQYINSASNSATYTPPGGNIQGICPSGYHIPSDAEWSSYEYCLESTLVPTGATTLTTFQTATGYRGTNTAGIGPADKMKVTSGNTPSWDGTNTSSFSALPGGYYFTGSGFLSQGSIAYFLSATEASPTNAWNRHLDSGTPKSYRGNGFKTNGYFLRCLKN